MRQDANSWAELSFNIANKCVIAVVKGALRIEHVEGHLQKYSLCEICDLWGISSFLVQNMRGVAEK